jgi:hypothetical protein
VSRPGKSRVVVWRDAIRDSTLDPTARHVAHALSTWMNGHGACYPRRETIAAGTGYSLRTIDRALAELETAGWLAIERGAGRRTNRYLALLPVVASELRHKEWAYGATDDRSGATDDHSGVTSDTRKRLKRESGGSTASALSGASAEPRYPEGECEDCRRVKGLVDSDARLCRECYDAITDEAIDGRLRARATRRGAA